MRSPPRSIKMPVPHAEHVYLVAQGGFPSAGVEEVSTSWRRSANEHGVNPDSTETPRILTSYELKELQESLDQLIVSAQDEIDRLYKVVREAGYTLLFCDTAGVAVEHRGDPADASRFKYWGTWLGGVWSEAIEGTNGIGTCIAEERPVTVHRNQHFRSRHIDLSCSAAPRLRRRWQPCGSVGRLRDRSRAVGTSPRIDRRPDGNGGARNRGAIFPRALSPRMGRGGGATGGGRHGDVAGR